MTPCARCGHPIHEQPAATPYGWMHPACSVEAAHAHHAAHPQPHRWLTTILPFAITLVAGGGYFLYKSYLLPGPGAECDNDGDCRGLLDAACVFQSGDKEAYCSVSCDSRSDCPKGWVCEPASISPFHRASGKVCFDPARSPPEEEDDD